MLSIPEAVAHQAHAAQEKSELVARPGLFAVRTMLAGAYIGIGVVIMVTAGGPLKVAGSPWAPLVQGAVFGVALTIVVLAGAELATSSMMYLAQGALLRTVRWSRAAVVLLLTLGGNLVGAFAFAAVVHLAGTTAPDTAPGQAIAAMIEHKAAETDAQLFFRGVLCNVLVCLAVWISNRLTSEGARIAAIFACVLVFITSGFEHVVANMTTFALGIYGGLPDATLLELGRNVLLVGLGNTVGGAVVVGAAYAYGVRTPAALVAPAHPAAAPVPAPLPVPVPAPLPVPVPAPVPAAR